MNSLRRIGKKELGTGTNKIEVQYKSSINKYKLKVKCEFNSAKLPKWCGERPGKKSGEPSTPEEENVADDVDGNIEDLGMIEDVPEVNEEDEDFEEEEEEEGEEDEDYEYE